MWSILAPKKKFEKVVTIIENELKSKVTVKVIDNITCKYPGTKDYVEENVREICEGEGLVVEEIICFVVYLLSILRSFYSCLWIFERINGMVFHT